MVNLMLCICYHNSKKKERDRESKKKEKNVRDSFIFFIIKNSVSTTRKIYHYINCHFFPTLKNKHFFQHLKTSMLCHINERI